VDPFWIDKTEVTRAAYALFIAATGYRPPYVDEGWAEEDHWNWQGAEPPGDTAQHPVVLTSWYDAEEYCRWAGKRLPTEAEWQLAALGPRSEGRRYPWGRDYDGQRVNHGKIAEPNYDDSDGYLYTSPVGAFPSGASPYGLLDMFGNAWEFTSDWRRDDWDHTEHGQRGELWTSLRAPGPGLYVAVRGGAYFFDMSEHPEGERNEFLPELRRKTSGFRCARDLDP
jgi:formylglycine-generating enzyme required for sulfatase activity